MGFEAHEFAVFIDFFPDAWVRGLVLFGRSARGMNFFLGSATEKAHR